MPRRTKDWLRQAGRDLEHSKADLNYFTEKEAKEAIGYADKIIRFCKDNIT